MIACVAATLMQRLRYIFGHSAAKGVPEHGDSLQQGVVVPTFIDIPVNHMLIGLMVAPLPVSTWGAAFANSMVCIAWSRSLTKLLL